MVKVVLVPVLFATLGLAACGDDGIAGGYTCQNAVQGEGHCQSFQACCNPSGSCYYLADGTKFDCNVADCTQAAQQAVLFCVGSDVISSLDVPQYELPDLSQFELPDLNLP